MHLHLNPLGGLAGDMFCAGVLDAYPEVFSELAQLIGRLGTFIPVEIALQETPGLLSGKRFRVRASDKVQKHHTAFAEIRQWLDKAPMDPEIRALALGIFQLLAEAEAEVHGVTPDQVTFHEVGSWDSITDIVSAAFLLDRLDIRSASCAPLPLGAGRVRTAHGMLPVPAPATAYLLRGLPVTDDGIGGERVTPTGAAILKFLRPLQRQPDGSILKATGMGFGTRELPGLPNCVQMLFLEDAMAELSPSAGSSFQMQTDRVMLLSFEVDDQNPEDFAVAMDHLRDHGDVLSVTSLHAIGKCGRPTLKVEILCRRDGLPSVSEACFRETTTIGLRWQEISRFVLPRRQSKVSADGELVNVKTVQRPQGLTAKTENRDTHGLDNHAARERLRRAGASAGVRQEMDGD